jgi:hypothetical protein
MFISLPPEEEHNARAGPGIAKHAVMQTGFLHDERDFNEFVIVDAVVSVIPVKFRHDAPDRLVVVAPGDLSRGQRVGHGQKAIRRPGERNAAFQFRAKKTQYSPNKLSGGVVSCETV